MTVVFMSQPLRQSQAADYLWTRPEEEKKIVVSHATSPLDVSVFPPGTEVLTWGSGSVSPRIASRLTDRARSFLRGGSPVAAALGRWLRSAEWRLRYLDRIQTLVHKGGGAQATDFPHELVELVEGLSLTDSSQVAVFDVFDLPVALAIAESHRCEVTVR